MSCYVDTSALAKWYIPESGSVEFETFVQSADTLLISRLVIVEMRCLMARRQRSGQLRRTTAEAAYRLFANDVTVGHLTMLPVPDARFGEALDLINRLDDVPLRTLDAIHLAAAEAAQCDSIATGDLVMQAAAARLGMNVAFFGTT